ncbi:uncharacterized protein LOC115877501 isoform X2 [Sitophilus oryzae]|uniref:Uncharacterized protein LOC115877501 isoform X2 n=1 Tax=Sitophilus oryzae TaxID=7048 RepID=A0A6J2XF23_SITOR|nr:uncharacterized protein LOC115877501 isoform X2 [Sitophilus oryzae]
MVNSGSFTSDPGKPRYQQLGDATTVSQTADSGDATDVACKTECSKTADNEDSAADGAPTAARSDETAAQDDDEKASLCCSLPLDKVQGVLTTTPPPDQTAEDKAKSPRKMLCLYCDRSFVSANLRQKHVERAHSTKPNRRVSARRQNQLSATPCVYCDKLNTSEHTLNDLFKHYVREHTSKYFGCLKCEERFLTLPHLTDHNSSKHSVDKKPPMKLYEVDPAEDGDSDDSDQNITPKLTRSKLKVKTEDSPETDTASDVAKRPESKRKTKIKDMRTKKIGVKTSKIALKRSKRLQAQAKDSDSQKKRRERKAPTSGKSDTTTDKSKGACVNPYPEFDNFYRVKKITDHSIDNLKISSLTFDDVFDKAFFNRIKCNIEENLLHHIDGKLFKNEESESRISNFEKEVQNSNPENYGCDLSLNAITPVASISLNPQFGEDFESQIEYGAKPSKKKTQTNNDEVHYKYFTRRKYQASILLQKENRDLSKLDMWTQMVVKERQERISNNKKSAKEMEEYTLGHEYKNKIKKEELNRILDRRGPFEDLKEEASKKAAFDKLNLTSDEDISEEVFSDVREVLNDILDRVFEVVTEEDRPTENDSKEIDHRQIPVFLDLRRRDSSIQEEIDRSDRIALICSSQETENFEASTNKSRSNNELIELTGEWARSRMYICAACGGKFPNMRYLLDHKSAYHQNVWVQHYEFVGNQSELYRHLSIPGLGKIGVVENSVSCKQWKRSDSRTCTKCGKQCNSLGELHRHVLECGGDWTWMLARKKCKYRPFGAKSRRKRKGLVRRVSNKQKTEPSEKKINKKPLEGPRQRPSDADTIQRMLANLPAKRSRRSLISLRDVVFKSRTNSKSQNQTTQTRKIACGKTICNKQSTVPNNSKVSNNKSHSKSLRSINKVLSSRILDFNSSIMVKRKMKAIHSRRSTIQRLREQEDDDTSSVKSDASSVSQKRKSPKKDSEESSPETNKKRTLGRKLITSRLNIKNFFPIRKKSSENSKSAVSGDSSNTTENATRNKKKNQALDDLEDNSNSGYTQHFKTNKKGGLKGFVRALSLRKRNSREDDNIQVNQAHLTDASDPKNTTAKKPTRVKAKTTKPSEASSNPDSEDTKTEQAVPKKRKLQRRVQDIIDKVKKSKSEKTQIQPTKKNLPKGSQEQPFLEEKSTLLDIMQPETVVSPAEVRENMSGKKDHVPIVPTLSDSKENPPIPETIFNLNNSEEKSLQAKGQLDFDQKTKTNVEVSIVRENPIISVTTDVSLEETKHPVIPTSKSESILPVLVDTTLKPKCVPMVSPNLKGKIKKPNRGLNDCIAMLTSKLQQKEEKVSSSLESLFSTSSVTSSEVRNEFRSPVESGFPPLKQQKNECILKIPSFKASKSPVVEEEAALDLSKKSYSSPNLLSASHNDIKFDAIENTINRVIEGVIEHKCKEVLTEKLAAPTWSVDLIKAIQNPSSPIKKLNKKTFYTGRTHVDDTIDFVVNSSSTWYEEKNVSHEVKNTSSKKPRRRKNSDDNLIKDIIFGKDKLIIAPSSTLQELPLIAKIKENELKMQQRNAILANQKSLEEAHKNAINLSRPCPNIEKPAFISSNIVQHPELDITITKTVSEIKNITSNNEQSPVSSDEPKEDKTQTLNATENIEKNITNNIKLNEESNSTISDVKTTNVTDAIVVVRKRGRPPSNKKKVKGEKNDIIDKAKLPVLETNIDLVLQTPAPSKEGSATNILPNPGTDKINLTIDTVLGVENETPHILENKSIDTASTAPQYESEDELPLAVIAKKNLNKNKATKENFEVSLETCTPETLGKSLSKNETEDIVAHLTTDSLKENDQTLNQNENVNIQKEPVLVENSTDIVKTPRKKRRKAKSVVKKPPAKSKAKSLSETRKLQEVLKSKHTSNKLILDNPDLPQIGSSLVPNLIEEPSELVDDRKSVTENDNLVNLSENLYNNDFFEIETLKNTSNSICNMESEALNNLESVHQDCSETSSKPIEEELIHPEGSKVNLKDQDPELNILEISTEAIDVVQQVVTQDNNDNAKKPSKDLINRGNKEDEVGVFQLDLVEMPNEVSAVTDQDGTHEEKKDNEEVTKLTINNTTEEQEIKKDSQSLLDISLIPSEVSDEIKRDTNELCMTNADIKESNEAVFNSQNTELEREKDCAILDISEVPLQDNNEDGGKQDIKLANNNKVIDEDESLSIGVNDVTQLESDHMPSDNDAKESTRIFLDKERTYLTREIEEYNNFKLETSKLPNQVSGTEQDLKFVDNELLNENELPKLSTDNQTSKSDSEPQSVISEIPAQKSDVLEQNKLHEDPEINLNESTKLVKKRRGRRKKSEINIVSQVTDVSKLESEIVNTENNVNETNLNKPEVSTYQITDATVQDSILVSNEMDVSKPSKALVSGRRSKRKKEKNNETELNTSENYNEINSIAKEDECNVKLDKSEVTSDVNDVITQDLLNVNSEPAKILTTSRRSRRQREKPNVSESDESANPALISDTSKKDLVNNENAVECDESQLNISEIPTQEYDVKKSVENVPNNQKRRRRKEKVHQSELEASEISNQVFDDFKQDVILSCNENYVKDQDLQLNMLEKTTDINDVNKEDSIHVNKENDANKPKEVLIKSPITRRRRVKGCASQLNTPEISTESLDATKQDAVNVNIENMGKDDLELNILEKDIQISDVTVNDLIQKESKTDKPTKSSINSPRTRRRKGKNTQLNAIEISSEVNDTTKLDSENLIKDLESDLNLEKISTEANNISMEGTDIDNKTDTNKSTKKLVNSPRTRRRRVKETDDQISESSVQVNDVIIQDSIITDTQNDVKSGESQLDITEMPSQDSYVPKQDSLIADNETDIKEPTKPSVTNQRTRRKSKSSKKIDKINNELFKDFSLVINKKTKRILPSSIVDDSVCDDVLDSDMLVISPTENIKKMPDNIDADLNNCLKTSLNNSLLLSHSNSEDPSPNSSIELNDTVEEMDMELEDIPINASIIERNDVQICTNKVVDSKLKLIPEINTSLNTLNIPTLDKMTGDKESETDFHILTNEEGVMNLTDNLQKETNIKETNAIDVVSDIKEMMEEIKSQSANSPLDDCQITKLLSLCKEAYVDMSNNDIIAAQIALEVKENIYDHNDLIGLKETNLFDIPTNDTDSIADTQTNSIPTEDLEQAIKVSDAEKIKSDIFFENPSEEPLDQSVVTNECDIENLTEENIFNSIVTEDSGFIEKSYEEKPKKNKKNKTVRRTSKASSRIKKAVESLQGIEFSDADRLILSEDIQNSKNKETNIISDNSFNSTDKKSPRLQRKKKEQKLLDSFSDLNVSSVDTKLNINNVDTEDIDCQNLNISSTDLNSDFLPPNEVQGRRRSSRIVNKEVVTDNENSKKDEVTAHEVSPLICNDSPAKVAVANDQIANNKKTKRSIEFTEQKTTEIVKYKNISEIEESILNLESVGTKSRRSRKLVNYNEENLVKQALGTAAELLETDISDHSKETDNFEKSDDNSLASEHPANTADKIISSPVVQKEEDFINPLKVFDFEDFFTSDDNEATKTDEQDIKNTYLDQNKSKLSLTQKVGKKQSKRRQKNTNKKINNTDQEKVSSIAKNPEELTFETLHTNPVSEEIENTVVEHMVECVEETIENEHPEEVVISQNISAENLIENGVNTIPKLKISKIKRTKKSLVQNENEKTLNETNDQRLDDSTNQVEYINSTESITDLERENKISKRNKGKYNLELDIDSKTRQNRRSRRNINYNEENLEKTSIETNSTEPQDPPTVQKDVESIETLELLNKSDSNNVQSGEFKQITTSQETSSFVKEITTELGEKDLINDQTNEVEEKNIPELAKEEDVIDKVTVSKNLKRPRSVMAQEESDDSISKELFKLYEDEQADLNNSASISPTKTPESRKSKKPRNNMDIDISNILDVDSGFENRRSSRNKKSLTNQTNRIEAELPKDQGTTVRDSTEKDKNDIDLGNIPPADININGEIFDTFNTVLNEPEDDILESKMIKSSTETTRTIKKKQKAKKHKQLKNEAVVSSKNNCEPIEPEVDTTVNIEKSDSDQVISDNHKTETLNEVAVDSINIFSNEDESKQPTVTKTKSKKQKSKKSKSVVSLKNVFKMFDGALKVINPNKNSEEEANDFSEVPLTDIITSSEMDIAPVLDEIDKSLESEDIYEFNEEPTIKTVEVKTKYKNKSKTKSKSSFYVDIEEPLDNIDSVDTTTVTRKRSNRSAKTKALENINAKLAESGESKFNTAITNLLDQLVEDMDTSILGDEDVTNKITEDSVMDISSGQTEVNNSLSDQNILNYSAEEKESTTTDAMVSSIENCSLSTFMAMDKNVEEENNLNQLNENLEKSDLEETNEFQELRRSRRGSRKVASYNENDLIDPLIDALEKRRSQVRKDKSADKSSSKKDVSVQDVEKSKKHSNEQTTCSVFDKIDASCKGKTSNLDKFDKLIANDDTRSNIPSDFGSVPESYSFEDKANVTDIDKIYEFTEDSPENTEEIRELFSKSKKRFQASKRDFVVDSEDISANLSSPSIDNKKPKEDKSKDNNKEKPAYCEICNKSFIRIENLLKHKTTLTHISKLSELEAKEAEKRASAENVEADVEDPSETVSSAPLQVREEISITDILQQSETSAPQVVQRDATSTNNRSLNLVDIISDVLNKPVLETYNAGKHSYSDMAIQNKIDGRQYKSLAERKSFDADSQLSAMSSSIPDPYLQPEISKTSILEKQINLLENIIGSNLENVNASIQPEHENNFIDISSCSNGSDVSEANSYVSNRSFHDNTELMPDCNNPQTGFVKPNHYEEISEDSTIAREKRKTLNRDEELFLECCSLLKSGSEVSNSNFSKNSKKPLGHPVESSECKWRHEVELVQRSEEAHEYSDNSRTPTPLGDTYDDDASNSNTISSNWHLNSEKPPTENRSFSFEEVISKEDNDSHSGISFGEMLTKGLKNQFGSSPSIQRRIEITSSTPNYSGDEKKDDSDCSTASKKIITKGARKVFEGLKVSIPTEELNLELLNHSPLNKKYETKTAQDISEPSNDTPVTPSKPRPTRKSKPVKKSQVGSNLLFKVNKKKNSPKTPTIMDTKRDVYNFEETQCNTDIFVKPTSDDIINKNESNIKETTGGLENSDNESLDYTDSNGADARSISTISSVSAISFKKPEVTTPENITKKKYMIMGKIFKNAAKSKMDEIDEELRNIPEIPEMDNLELVENYVRSCQNVSSPIPPPMPPPAFDELPKKPKMTEEEMNMLFDQLLGKDVTDHHPTPAAKSQKSVSKHLGPKVKTDKNSDQKKKCTKPKNRKRMRGNSESSDDEFNLNKTIRKRTNRKNNDDSGINLELELKECIGVASRKSQRKCTSGKQNILVEYWSSDEEAFEALLETQKIPPAAKEETKKKPEPKTDDLEEEIPTPNVPEPDLSKENLFLEPPLIKPVKPNKLTQKKKIATTSKKPKIQTKNPQDPNIPSSTVNRRKRAAANPLYHWSSSSEDESQSLIEIKPLRKEYEDEEDRPIQHGWIVGDSPKKLVTMLALTKGKKTEVDSVKEQGKRRTSNTAS